MKSLSHGQLFATPWTVVHQAPLSMGFSRQEYWSGLPFPSPGNLPDPGIKPRSPALQGDSSPSEPSGKIYIIYMASQVVLVVKTSPANAGDARDEFFPWVQKLFWRGVVEKQKSRKVELLLN